MYFKSVARAFLGMSIALLPLPAAAQTAPATPAPAPAWTTFTPQEGGFTVLLGGTPRRDESAIAADTPGGPGRTVFYTVQGADHLFQVGWGEYAPGFNFDDQAELAANRDNFVNGLKVDRTANKAITLGGAPGLEFDFAKSGVLFGRGRVYILNRKPYLLVFLHRGTALDTVRANRFLDSFKPTGGR